MSVRSMVSDTVASHKRLVLHDVESRWISAVGGQLMRWKAFFKTLFSWRRLSMFSEFPVETLIFYVGSVVVVILIKQC